MNDREPFLKALAKNEDDVLTRMVYADWLDEQGEHEEADRQRKWPAAKAWLLEFTKSINYHGYAEDDEYKNPLGSPHTYADVIQAGHDAVSGEGYCFGSDDGADYFRGERAAREEFFRNWSIVTGVPVPEEVVDNPPFRCAC
jgi:uncharacterized protein (TIGR02996 family)